MKTHAIVTILVLVSAGCRQNTPAPEATGIDAVFQNAVDNGDVTGVVAIAATPVEVTYQGAFGKAELDIDMTLDSMFRIASMTKAVTSVAAMQLVDEGAIELDEPVSTYISDFAPKGTSRALTRTRRGFANRAHR